MDEEEDHDKVDRGGVCRRTMAVGHFVFGDHGELREHRVGTSATDAYWWRGRSERKGV